MKDSGEFSYFDHEGALFRRRNNGLTRSVDDILNESTKQWVPYRGADPLAPALYGDEIPDPLAGDDVHGDRAAREGKNPAA